jgi:hypothetical protein
LPNKNFLVSHKKLNKLLHKGVVSAVVYVQKLQLDSATTCPTPELSNILSAFEDILQKPKDLPHARDIDHRIPLSNESTIVNTRSYRLSFKQKDTMEALILQLLQNQVIRPSVSPYSSPTILVKKKDGT